MRRGFALWRLCVPLAVPSLIPARSLRQEEQGRLRKYQRSPEYRPKTYHRRRGEVAPVARHLPAARLPSGQLANRRLELSELGGGISQRVV
jgi:hypothetical protein